MVVIVLVEEFLIFSNRLLFSKANNVDTRGKEEAKRYAFRISALQRFAVEFWKDHKLG